MKPSPEASILDVSTGEAYEGRAAPDSTLLGLFRTLLANRKLLVRSALLGLIAFVAYALAQPNYYVSVGTFVPQSGRSRSGLSGVASQLGLSLPSTETGESPQFYRNLLLSKQILGRAAESEYRIDKGGQVITTRLPEIFNVPGGTPAMRRATTMEHLARDVSASVDAKTGVITYSVRAGQPDLAHGIALRLMALLSEFNLERRQSQAGSERKFTEARLEEVARDLRAAEDRMQTYLQGNRDPGTSPRGAFERDRLQREINARQAIYSALSQAYEQAKIEEVRDTPVVTVIDRPERPVKPASRALLKRGFTGLVAGLAAGMIIILLLEYLRARRVDDTEQFHEFSREKSAAMRDLKQPWRLLFS